MIYKTYIYKTRTTYIFSHVFTIIAIKMHLGLGWTWYYIRIYKFINCILHMSVWACVGCRLVWLQVYSVSTCASCIVMRSYHLCCLVLPASSLGFSTSLTFLYLPMLEECVYHCASTKAMWITQIIGLMQDAAPFAAKLATLRS